MAQRGAMWVSVLLVATMAGCTGTVGDGPETAQEPLQGRGSVTGIVLDPAIAPIADAQVTLSPGDRWTQTDAEGRFSFPDQEPGAYVVEARHDRYHASAALVNVVAGQTSALLRLTLEPDLEAQPYVKAEQVRGLYKCGVSWKPGAPGQVGCAQPAIWLDLVCDTAGVCLSSLLDATNFVTFRDYDGYPDAIHAEMVWDPSSIAAESMMFNPRAVEKESEGTVAAYWGESLQGPSPLVYVTDRALIEEHDIGGANVMQYLIYQGHGDSVHVVLEQEFEFFQFSFYRWQPPADWIFSRDGPVTPP